MAQDIALSRRQHGFDSRWGCHKIHRPRSAFFGSGPFSAPPRESNPVGGASVKRVPQTRKGHAANSKGRACAPLDLNGEKINDPNAAGRNKAVPSGTPLQIQIIGCFRRWLNVLSFERAPRCIRIGTIPAAPIRIGVFLAILVRIDVILAAITRIDAVFAAPDRIVALLAVLGRIATFIAVPANASRRTC